MYYANIKTLNNSDFFIFSFLTRSIYSCKNEYIIKNNKSSIIASKIYYLIIVKQKSGIIMILSSLFFCRLLYIIIKISNQILRIKIIDKIENHQNTSKSKKARKLFLDKSNKNKIYNA